MIHSGVSSVRPTLGPKAILGNLRATLGKLRVNSNRPWPNQQPRGPGIVLSKTSPPRPLLISATN